METMYVCIADENDWMKIYGKMSEGYIS